MVVAVQQAIPLAQQVPRWAARVAAVQAKPKQLARWAQQAKASVAATVAAAPVALAAAAAARVVGVKMLLAVHMAVTVEQLLRLQYPAL